MPALPQLSGRQLVMLGLGLLVGGIVLIGTGVGVYALSQGNSRGTSSTPSTSAPIEASPTASSASHSAQPSWTSSAPSLPTATPVATAPAPSPAPGAPTPVPAPAQTRIGAYRGLGSWVDIYDDRAWKDPAAAVADMAAHGVKTLYLETGNSRSSGELFKPEKIKQFISESHAHDMKIVAWYLPDMIDPAKDFSRINSAIQLQTSDGQRFDSFALDIESGAIKSQKPRNRALMALSRQIRAAVGPAYPLGAIIPSPVGLSRKGSYWGTFPYTDLAPIYDVFVPMGYYTYHGKGAALSYSDTVGNARILRSKPGCSAVPIHMIGGIAEKSSTAEVQAFVRGTQESGCIGASLYSWPGTKAGAWSALAGVGTGTP